jgi:hypothetical protein
MAEVQEYNPFLAPVSATIEAGQPDQSLGDKEYVVLPRRILCREKVVLPEICVFYGDTQGLEPRQRTLRSLKPFASFFLFVMTSLALPLSGFVFGASISWWSRGMIALALSCLISIVGLLIWRKGCNKVDATWYVCLSYRQRAAMEYKLARAVVYCAGIGLLFATQWVEWPFQMLFVAITICMLAGLKLKCEEHLKLAGKRGDVFLLHGHKKKFFEAVRRQENQF